MSILGLLILGK